MKNFKFTKNYITIITLLIVTTISLSCTFDEEFDPNRPSLEGILTDASVNQLNNLVVGVESGMRSGISGQTVHSGQWQGSFMFLMLIPETLEIYLEQMELL